MMYARASGGKLYHLKDTEVPSQGGPALCGFEPGAGRRSPRGSRSRSRWVNHRPMSDPPRWRFNPICPKCQERHDASM